MRATSDGSVPGTHFYDDAGEVVQPAGITLQQEGMSAVRLRFAAHYAIESLVMGPDDTLTVNMEHDG